jgi:hypothetical protein
MGHDGIHGLYGSECGLGGFDEFCVPSGLEIIGHPLYVNYEYNSAADPLRSGMAPNCGLRK